MSAPNVSASDVPRAAVARRPAGFQDPAYQAFWLLRIAFVAAPLLFGLDKFFDWLVVAVRPRFGGYLVAAWLAGIILNLVLVGDYYDVALRDFGLLLAALT